MQTQTIKTTVEIDSNLFYLAKMRALQEKKSLKEIVNLSLAKNLGVDTTKTVDLLSKIQMIVKESKIAEKELQKSANKLRKQLVKKYYS